QLGNFETFEELFDHFPPMLSGYQPASYLEDDLDDNSGVKKDVLKDEKLRDRFLVKMIYILMVKLSFDGITVIHTIVVTTQYAVIAFSFALPHQLRHR
ncbi:MAG: hypothetical protein ACK5YH_14250, partial [Pseudanabaena sp.]